MTTQMVIVPNHCTRKPAYVVEVEYKTTIDKREQFRAYVASQVDLWNKVEKSMPIDNSPTW